MTNTKTKKPGRISVHICCKDRSSELGLLLQSLRGQTFKEWDLVLVDSSKTPKGQLNPLINTYYYLGALTNRLKIEGHKVIYKWMEPMGVCNARNEAIKIDDTGNEFICRIDDDSICEPDYLMRLFMAITTWKISHIPQLKLDDIGAVCGVVPMLGQPDIVRDGNKFKKLSEIKWDKEGNITQMNDDLWALYKPDKILEVDTLRSSFIMKRSALEKIKLWNGDIYDTGYGKTGFREETDLSLRLKMAGYKLLVDTGAVCWHLMCPSGGVKAPDYIQRVQMGDDLLKRRITKWVKTGKLK